MRAHLRARKAVNQTRVYSGISPGTGVHCHSFRTHEQSVLVCVSLTVLRTWIVILSLMLLKKQYTRAFPAGSLLEMQSPKRFDGLLKMLLILQS